MTVPGYELDAPLGRGSMGTVHRARRLDALGRVVALKRVPMTGDAELTDRLRQEAALLASLDHPHIVRILELVDDGEGVAIAMQLAVGGSLADRLAGGARLEPGAAATLAAKVADALASAHRRGVLHCDVKPANILFTADQEPLLSDFGLARWVARASLWGGAVVGTAEYLDPAVAEGAAPDERSDVYALGAVCYEALAGRPPHTGATPLAVLRAADRADHEPLGVAAPTVPAELAAVVERAMARRPADRFASAAELAAALRSAGGLECGGETAVRQGPSLDPTAGVGCLPATSCAVATESGGDAAAGPPTRRFGPAPLARAVAEAPEGRPDRGRPGVLRVAAGVIALAGVVSAAAAFGPNRHDGRPGLRPCSDQPVPVAAPGTTVVAADVTGRGCTVPVVWDGHVATVGGMHYRLGRDGDVLVVGDWDGDRVATPALYRPDDGRIYLFSQWAGGTAPVAPASVRSTGVTHGHPTVVHHPHHPDTIRMG